MTEEHWLCAEARRIIDDLDELITDINLIERRYQVQMSDKDQTVVLGKNEWSLFKSRVADACSDMGVALNDFLENDYRQQLHWSGLRLLTASGVLTAELRAYREKLSYISRHPSNTSIDVHKLFNWFVARVEPMSGRLSARLVQFLSRVLAPQHWQITSELGDLGAQNPSSVSLSMSFEPLDEEAAKVERERVNRLKRLDVN
ncbi:MAG: hypothetical protein AB8G17_19535 [Gammaproteobacteria bacterium]